jgi:hypothetical protein
MIKINKEDLLLEDKFVLEVQEFSSDIIKMMRKQKKQLIKMVSYIQEMLE